MKYKVETSLRYFHAWQGGKDTLDVLIEKGDVDDVEWKMRSTEAT